jgi:hypothetical protein
MLRRLLFALMLWATQAWAQTYAGPTSLGPFQIDKDVLVDSLFKKLGPPAKVAGDTFCYQTRDGHTFLVLSRMVSTYDPRVAGEVQLSDFRNCLDKPVRITPADLSVWKTERGIGLGSPRDDVVKAYGKPSVEESIGTDYRAIIHGSPAESKRKPEVGTKVLGYRGTTHDLRAAFFGIREERVAWIWLSRNE